jgi:hypothetical protein
MARISARTDANSSAAGAERGSMTKYVAYTLQEAIRLPNGEETEERWIYDPIEVESVNILGAGSPSWLVKALAAAFDERRHQAPERRAGEK